MREETRLDWEHRAGKVVAALAMSLDDPPRLEEAASEAASSPWHFHRRFRELTGESFAACLRRLLLERGAYRLRGGFSVIEAAFDAGFGSPEAFSRAFSRAFQLPPSRVAALPFWNGELAAPNGLHYRPRRSIEWFSPGQRMDVMETRLVELKPMAAAGLSGEGDPWKLPDLWSRLREALGPGARVEAGDLLTLFLPGGRFAAAMLAPRGKLPDGLEEFTLPGGLYAAIPHFGPPEAIGPFWDR